jgi:SAM-dependent methyltransferase
MNGIHEHNRRAWDERVRRGDWHTETAREKDFTDPLAAVDGTGWLGGNVRGKSVLCLAAGGGKHSVLFAAAGAVVTVVDLSPQMLELDRKLAAERSLRVQTVEASMDNLSMLPTAAFDAVIQPVSTCYVPDVAAVYREVARVIAPGGLYISQHKQPASLQAEAMPKARRFVLAEPYYRTGPLPPVIDGSLHREAGTMEFLHRWEELIGGLCRAGFVLEDFMEPRHGDLRSEPGTFRYRSAFLPPFVTLKARRMVTSVHENKPTLWTP